MGHVKKCSRSKIFADFPTNFADFAVFFVRENIWAYGRWSLVTRLFNIIVATHLARDHENELSCRRHMWRHHGQQIQLSAESRTSGCQLKSVSGFRCAKLASLFVKRRPKTFKSVAHLHTPTAMERRATATARDHAAKRKAKIDGKKSLKISYQ